MIDDFIKNGWVIVDIPDPDVIYSIRAILDPVNATIEKHKELSELFWREEFSLKLAKALLPVVQHFIGLDILVQYYPYLRIVRPRKYEDNIGFHKDTQYGQTPYELAVHIPFVDLDEKAAIRVISGSHVMPENAFTKVTPDGMGVEKGSIENRMGKPYAPKCLKVPDGMQTVPLAMKVGQCAIFSPALFHGQEVNEGNVTRVSCDLRFVGMAHADKVRVGKMHAGYVSVSESPVENLASKYYGAQSAN